MIPLLIWPVLMLVAEKTTTGRRDWYFKKAIFFDYYSLPSEHRHHDIAAFLVARFLGDERHALILIVIENLSNFLTTSTYIMLPAQK